MSFTELALIMFVALVLFGPEDLPVIARTLGKIVYQVRKYSSEITREFQEAMDTPGKVINDVLKDAPPKAKAIADNKEANTDTEELLSYEDTLRENSGTSPQAQDANPLADLPADIISHPKEPQAGE